MSTSINWAHSHQVMVFCVALAVAIVLGLIFYWRHRSRPRYLSYEAFRQRIKQEQQAGRKLLTAEDYYAWTTEAGFPANMPKDPPTHYSTHP